MVMLLANCGGHSFFRVDVFKEAQRARGRDVQRVTAYEQKRKDSWDLKGQCQGSQLMWLLQYSYPSCTSFII